MRPSEAKCFGCAGGKAYTRVRPEERKTKADSPELLLRHSPKWNMVPNGAYRTALHTNPTVAPLEFEGLFRIGEVLEDVVLLVHLHTPILDAKAGLMPVPTKCCTDKKHANYTQQCDHVSASPVAK